MKDIVKKMWKECCECLEKFFFIEYSDVNEGFMGMVVSKLNYEE